MFILISTKYKDSDTISRNMKRMKHTEKWYSAFDWSQNSKIYPLEPETDSRVITVREALIGQRYYYAGTNSLRIPHGTILGVLTYKRFREPVIYDPKRFVGSYTCKFTNMSLGLEPDELIGYL